MVSRRKGIKRHAACTTAPQCSDASTRTGHVALITTSSPAAARSGRLCHLWAIEDLSSRSLSLRVRVRADWSTSHKHFLSSYLHSIAQMAPIDVKIKHAGKVHDVQLDPDVPPAVFKEAVYQVTGVPPDRMKVMIKGGILKVRMMRGQTSFPVAYVQCMRAQDDTDWRKVAPKAVSSLIS